MKPTTKSMEAYRVRVRREDLTLRWRVGSLLVEAEILSLSVEEVTFAVPADAVTSVAAGDSCPLFFHDVRQNRHIEVVGLITACQCVEEELRVQVRLCNREQLLESLQDSETWRHFNRRRTFRIQPRSASFQPIQVHLKWGGFEGRFVLHDVSEGGLAIRIANRDGIEIPEERAIRVQIEDPLEAEPIEFVARKLHEANMGSHRRVGFVIDALRTVHRAQVEDRLARAVLHWQRHAIQARAQIETFHESPGTPPRQA